MESVCLLLENPIEGVKLSRVANESGPLLAKSRNMLVESFLEISDATHLWFVDTDIHFDLKVLPRLLADDVDIVCGLYYGMQDGERFIPAHIEEETLEGGTGLRILVAPELDAAPDPLIPVFSVATGCMLVKRRVLDPELGGLGFSIREMHPFGYDIYREQALGEDVTFCLRARKAGFEVFLDREARCGHLKRFLI